MNGFLNPIACYVNLAAECAYERNMPTVVCNARQNDAFREGSQRRTKQILACNRKKQIMMLGKSPHCRQRFFDVAHLGPCLSANWTALGLIVNLDPFVAELPNHYVGVICTSFPTFN
ncbi:hypothetical protein L484_026492 [Morus notabilis]|uniref:Uncharacterized protein n=1 Tax=Morus notabilis TaxID=981085 RepID=W9RAP3_9ROSA|nr:hypothetical protein L484_026492 [Morus notabilis]